MKLLTETLNAIVSIDAESGARAQALLDQKTKPRRSLGRLEDIVVRMASIQRIDRPLSGAKVIVVMAADHGVAKEGVSAYPQEVTGQMVLNFANGGAAINVLARHVGARVVVVDMGTVGEIGEVEGVRSRKVGNGTASMLEGPAMTRAEAVAAIETGIEIARELARDGVKIIGLGEMGIGNSTAASAITAAVTGIAAAEVTGRGTGIDDAALLNKVKVIEQALERNQPDPADGVDLLAKVGGFEIAGLAGVCLGAAAERVTVVMDGFIATSAALAASRLCAELSGYLLPSHGSVEVGHRVALRALGTTPILELEMRLGEGTGAAIAMGVIDGALKVLGEMATFEGAGVSDTGR